MPEAGKRKSYQTSAWKRGAVRQFVYNRDGWRCRICKRLGKQKGGEVTLSLQHWPVPEAKGGKATPSNLITLCLSCHGKMDGGRRY